MDVTFFTHHYHHDRSFLYGDSKCCVTLFSCLFIIERIFIPLNPWWDSLLGGGSIFLVLYAIQIVYPNGLGGGDVKLLALLDL